MPSSASVWVVVDVANVMGSRPDGWWKDRSAAATRLMATMPTLLGREVTTPDGTIVELRQITAVIEGAAKPAAGPPEIVVLRAPADGDTTIVHTAREYFDHGRRVLVITADRGLRARLPEGALIAGPGWWNALLGRARP